MILQKHYIFKNPILDWMHVKSKTIHLTQTNTLTHAQTQTSVLCRVQNQNIFLPTYIHVNTLT